MTNRFLLSACLLLFALSGFTSIQAKELKLAFDADPVTLDIHEQLSGGVLQLSHLSFDPLVRWNRDLTFEPRLATRYERLDPQTVRFHLRRGVRFHSGSVMTAADFKFTFDRLKSSPDFQGIFANFTELRVIDDYTIDLVTRNPDPLILHTATYLFPLDSKFYSGNDANGNDKAAIVKNGASFASTNLSGTGPFKLVSRERGSRIVFERFSDYWDGSTAGNVSRIVFTPIRDEQTRIAALLSGEVDFIAPVSPSNFSQIESSDEADLITMPGTRIIMLQMNQERREEFRDPRVRMAMVHAVDNVGIVSRIMNGFATPAAQFSPEGYAGHNTSLKPRYNLKLARQLMKDAGYANGFSITMMAPNNRYVNDEKIAQAVVEMLARINIKVELTTMPKAQYWPKFDDRKADVMMLGWHSDTDDSADFYLSLAMTPDRSTGFGAYNSGNYSSDYVDSLTIEANRETEPDKREQLLKKIEARLFQDAAFIPLHWQNLAWAAKKGVNIAPIVNALNLPYLGDLVID